MAKYEDSRDWTLGVPFGKWPTDPRVYAIQSELLGESQHRTFGPGFRAELRERLCARGIVPEDWLARAYDRRAAIASTEGLIEHRAFMHLAQDPQRMVTAENRAREVFKNVHFAGWVSPAEVHIIGRVDTYRPTVVTTFHVHGVHPQRIAQLWLNELVCKDWFTFFEAVQRDYPAWKPLFDLGVVPWLILGRGGHFYYILSSAHTVRTCTSFLWDSPSLNDEDALDAARTFTR